MTRNPHGRNDAVGHSLATPRWLLRRIVAAGYRLCWDVCAVAETSACGPDRYWGPEDDGLAQQWNSVHEASKWMWCNPPSGDIGPWADCAIGWQRKGVSTLMLLPVDIGTRWWMHAAPHADVVVLVPRLHYLDPETWTIVPRNTRNSALFHFLAGRERELGDVHSYGYWHVQRDRSEVS